MKCPFCKSNLIKGEKEQYTNTSEHVLVEWKQKGNQSTAAIGSWDRWMDNRNNFARFISPYLPKREGGWDDSYKISRIVFKFFEPKFSNE